jgi:AcrR family transcriptional regulator
MSSRKTWFIARIANEGYCCPNAYLRLCKARGENVRDMAKNIGMSADTIWYHYRKLKSTNGGFVCQRFRDCMDQVVQEIEDEKIPAEAGKSTTVENLKRNSA